MVEKQQNVQTEEEQQNVVEKQQNVQKEEEKQEVAEAVERPKIIARTQALPRQLRSQTSLLTSEGDSIITPSFRIALVSNANSRVFQPSALYQMWGRLSAAETGTFETVSHNQAAPARVTGRLISRV